MPSFPMGGGIIKSLMHPKVDKTSARRGIVGHAKNFKNGGLSDAAFEQKIKDAHEKLTGF